MAGADEKGKQTQFFAHRRRENRGGVLPEKFETMFVSRKNSQQSKMTPLVRSPRVAHVVDIGNRGKHTTLWFTKTL